MNLDSPPRYLLADDFDERSKDISMRRSAWNIAASISQLLHGGSYREFCSDLSLSENETTEVINELIGHKLVFENPLEGSTLTNTSGQFKELLKGSYSSLARAILGENNKPSPTDEKAPTTTLIRSRLGDFPKVSAPANQVISHIWSATSPSNPAADQIPFGKPSLNPSKAGNNGQTSVSKTTGGAAKTTPGKFGTKRFRLQPIMSQIEKLTSGGVEGSVLVYQVFLKVPPELLKREGIESLKFVDENTEFSSEELCRAIIRATTEITGYSLKIVGFN